MAKKLAKISLRLALFGILVGEGNGSGAGSAGLHDGTCPADGDVGAKGCAWELGYGVVGGPFAGGAAGFGGAVVLHSLNDAALVRAIAIYCDSHVATRGSSVFG